MNTPILSRHDGRENGQNRPLPHVPLAAESTLSTLWIPRAVRCPRCQTLAREQVRERLSEEEVAVRYGCEICRWQQTRHYHESELEKSDL